MTTTYVPGTLESDPKKINMSLQQIGPRLDTANANITSLTAATTAIQAAYVSTIDSKSGAFTSSTASGISSSTANVISLSQATTAQFGAVKVDGLTITSSSLGVVSTVQPLISKVTNSTTANVALNNTANYFTGPTVANTTSGTWFASGTVTVVDTANANFFAKLWDGTTVIASCETSLSTNFRNTMSLSGYLTNPAGNLRISVRDATNTTGTMEFNASGNSMDSTLTAIRIG